LSRPSVGATVRLGAFTVADRYPGTAQDPADRVVEIVRLAEVVESAGLASLWVAEHHFHDDGVCPSPPVVLAACGARTRRIRLGSLVSVLPFHRPVDVAEEYALVDRMTGGRLNFGVGSGYLPSELEAFGVSGEEKRARFESVLRDVLDAFGGRPIRVAGDRGPLVRPNVRPVQTPHPPLWIAVQRREAIAHVAARGASVALIPYATVGDLEELRDQVAEYRRSLPPNAAGEVAAAVHLYAGQHAETARQAFRRYVASRLASGSTHLVQKVRDHPGHASPEAIEAQGLAIFGTAEHVVRGLERFAEAGVDELLGIFDFGGLPPDEVEASVRAVGLAWAGSCVSRAPSAAGSGASAAGPTRANGL
jgi:alkanesulfonate monooxygenase SsuD/methylene tetrahydromethanopterin reductase-like flavin-dependent oxidoreductase (luciferase family)